MARIAPLQETAAPTAAREQAAAHAATGGERARYLTGTEFVIDAGLLTR